MKVDGQMEVRRLGRLMDDRRSMEVDRTVEQVELGKAGGRVEMVKGVRSMDDGPLSSLSSPTPLAPLPSPTLLAPLASRSPLHLSRGSRRHGLENKSLHAHDGPSVL